MATGAWLAEVRSREEARRIYDEIVRRQRDRGFAGIRRQGSFQASHFPIPPHSDKKLELTILRFCAGIRHSRLSLSARTGRQVTQIGSVAGRNRTREQGTTA